jgi:hypothetical protein
MPGTHKHAVSMPSQPLGIGLQTSGAGKVESFAVVLDEISAEW